MLLGRRGGVGAGLLGVAVIALAGCSEGPSGQSGADGTDGDTEASSGSDESGPPPSACEAPPPRVGLQRLTRAEYNRTVRDLFGVTGAPADAFPPDSATNGFDNNAASLTTSPQLAALLLDAAESVAAEAMANQGAEIVGCDPAADDYCARNVIAALALRVYRRPASDDELLDLLGLVEVGAIEKGNFSAGIEHALVAMLMSPQFLYRSVPADGTAPTPGGQLVTLDDYALASRLSYFLWGSTPDDQLLARAADGALTDSTSLRPEFDRMLADPKASALYDGFVRQWLQLGKLEAAAPDPSAFPAFNEELRAQMADETRLFFEGIRARDASMLEVVTGTQTYANESIAAIYGIAGVTGTALVPITTDATQRAGVLTMPAVLTMTSGPSDANIVKRGVWLAEAILCASPPPPPVGVPPPPDPMPGESERERLERHRLDPSCASCHDLIDPLGFGFEHYDAIGAWRDVADGEPIDDLGRLPGPDGATFTGVVALSQLLAGGEFYPSCVTGKLMTYALGRAMTGAEQCVVDEIGAQHVTPDATLSDLLWAVVTSDAFRTEEIAGDP